MYGSDPPKCFIYKNTIHIPPHATDSQFSLIQDTFMGAQLALDLFLVEFSIEKSSLHKNKDTKLSLWVIGSSGLQIHRKFAIEQCAILFR